MKPVQNILKVCDLRIADIGEETRSYLGEHGKITYRDEVMDEHLFNIDDTLDEIRDETIPAPSDAVRKELDEIQKTLSKKKCGYLRMVFE